MLSPSCPDDGCICKPLTSARRGDRVVVRHLQGAEADRTRLREMGIREEVEVHMVCGGGPVIAHVQGAKVCLSVRLAETILVAPA